MKPEKVMAEMKVLLWKELTDLKRDKKTLFTSILLPLLMLPLMGFIGFALAQEQIINVAVVDLDHATAHNGLLNITFSSKWLLGNITYYLAKYGYNYTVSNSTSIIKNPSIDLMIVIPRGFAENVTSLTHVAKIEIFRKAGLQTTSRVEGLIYSIVNWFSDQLSKEKIMALARLAGVNATFEALRNPITYTTTIVSISGSPVNTAFQIRVTISRFLVLALSFVVTPAASYVIDGIIGERERKTMELLLSHPVKPSTIINAKVIAATILGLITAIADAFGLLVYISLSAITYGSQAPFLIDPWLLLVHSITAFFTILVTVAISLPFITRTKGIRSASNIMSIVTMMAVVFFFTALFVDYMRLPTYILAPLYAIPYVHSILAIQTYVIGYPFQAFLHILFLAITSTTILYLTTKTLNTEKLLMSK